MALDLTSFTLPQLWESWLINATLINLTITFIATCCIGCFLWGVKAHFRQNGAMPLGMRIITLSSIGGYLVMLHLLLINDASALSKALGTALMLLALTIFWWAVRATSGLNFTLAYSVDSPITLVQKGPYRFVRHPFYLSYLCFWSAGVVATDTLLFGIVFLLMLGLYLRAALMEEAKFLDSPLRNLYREFQSQTGMFLPKFR